MADGLPTRGADTSRVPFTPGLATGMYAITHPSLPNYLALTGGATFGIDSDCTDCRVPSARSLADQLTGAHLQVEVTDDGHRAVAGTQRARAQHHLAAQRGVPGLCHEPAGGSPAVGQSRMVGEHLLCRNPG